jgi:hypothetical protein
MFRYEDAYPRINTWGEIGIINGGKKRNIHKLYMKKQRRQTKKGGSLHFSHGDHYDMELSPRGAGYMPIQSNQNCGAPSDLNLGASTQHGGSALHMATASHGFHADTKHEDIHALRGSYAPVTALSHGVHMGGRRRKSRKSKKSRKSRQSKKSRKSRQSKKSRKSRRQRGGYNQYMSNVAYTPSHGFNSTLHPTDSALATPTPWTRNPNEHFDDPYIHQ